MSNRIVPSTFAKSVLNNGVGRHVCQLQRITFNFCKEWGDSKGVREFIEQDLLDFAKQNPGVVVYLKPSRHKSASITGEYLNGNVINQTLKNYPREDVCKWVELLRTQQGFPAARLRKNIKTETPTIQGAWHPFLNKKSKINVTTFPSTDFALETPQSATEKLLELAEKLRAKNLVVEEEGKDVEV